MNLKSVTLAFALLFCLWLAPTIPSAAQQSSSDAGFDREKLTQLKRTLADLDEERQFSGTVLVADQGKIVFESSVGYSDFREEKRFDENASFRLASVSKQFTAMGIMLLKQDGKLDYDDDIRKHIPEIPYQGITVRHLLHHTGGIPDYMSLFAKHWDRETGFKNRKLAFNKDIVALIAEHKPKRLFAPGEKFAYSNTGYALLGYIIEKASGMSAREFLAERIFQPLEMEHSQVFSPERNSGLPHQVYGFTYSKRKSKPFIENDYHYLNGAFGDGGIYASARDLLKWDQALYGDKLVTQALIAEAFASGTLNDGSSTGYGFGWGIVEQSDDTVAVSHSGGWVGFRTFIYRDLRHKTVSIVLCNSASQLGKVLEVTRSLHDTYQAR